MAIPHGFTLTLEKNGQQIGKAVARHSVKDLDGIPKKVYWYCSCSIPAKWSERLYQVPCDNKFKMMKKLFGIKVKGVDVDPINHIISWCARCYGKKVISKQLEEIYSKTQLINEQKTLKELEKL